MNVSPSLSANCRSASEEGREEFDPVLRSDMLVSFTASMADMSVSYRKQKAGHGTGNEARCRHSPISGGGVRDT